jgi:dTDP-4-amino-4,6-dideoxygalactose transaminase
MNVPLVDLRAQYASIRDDVNRSVQGVLDRCDFILGGAVEEFEKSFAAFVGTSRCVSVASGTDALYLALRALSVGPGDEVILPANTFIATAIAVSQCGAKPVFADVRPDSYNLDPQDAARKVTERTRVLLPVHLFGQPADMDAIMALAKKHGHTVVEDACQSHGARWRGKACGSFGAAAGFSFYPGKNLGAYGDGGAVTTSDSDLAHRLELLRTYGQEPKNVHKVKGVNSRLDTLQAAVLNVKLRHLADWTRSRVRNALLYERHLGGVREVGLPAFDHGSEFSHVFHLYVIRAPRRDELARFLHDNGVACGIHYPTPIHLQGAYAELGHRRGDFPEAERAAGEILSLPMYAELTEEQIRHVADCIKRFFAGKS